MELGNLGKRDQQINGNFYGLFGLWDGEETHQARIRLGIYNDKNVLDWSPMVTDAHATEYPERMPWSDYSDPTAPWNLNFPVDVENFLTPTAFSITLDTSASRAIHSGHFVSTETDKTKEGDFYTFNLYENGNLKYTGDYNKLSWDDFTDRIFGHGEYFLHWQVVDD